MSQSPSSGLFLPLPGSPSSSWAIYKARLGAVLHGPNTRVLAAFWLFGLINNVLYVIILSAAQDLVGTLPKGVVLLADVVPSFSAKLVAPYFIHRIPYVVRVPVFAILSSSGMLLIATTPTDSPLSVKLAGVVLASLSSGVGELSFLGLTHYYGQFSLAAWGSGTGAAGLVGAGLYVLLTDWLGFSVRSSLLWSSIFPVFMLLSFFVLLPRGPLQHGPMTAAGPLRKDQSSRVYYSSVPGSDLDEALDNGRIDEHFAANSSSSGASADPDLVAGDLDGAPGIGSQRNVSGLYQSQQHHSSFASNLRRVRALFFPYMLPLLLVYVAEYTINQGVTPTLMFPLDESPFDEYRAFYPFYGFLYQLGVFISRSSTPFVRIHRLYVPSMLQVANLVILTAQAIYFDSFLPSVYFVFAIIFWEGLLGGAVYVNTFAEIMERVPLADREFSLGATTVSDSAGVCFAGFLGMAMEVSLCSWQVKHGRDWCRKIRRG